jgi:hypothetical protein
MSPPTIGCDDSSNLQATTPGFVKHNRLLSLYEVVGGLGGHSAPLHLPERAFHVKKRSAEQENDQGK